MLKNYFKTAFRNILRYKGFSLINIASFAIGTTGCLIICDAKSYFRAWFTGLFIFLLIPIVARPATPDGGSKNIPGDPLPDFLEMPVVKWKFETRKPFLASPVISGDKVYVGGLDSTLYAIDLNSGKASWKFTTTGEIRSNVLVDGNRVFLVAGDGSLYCMDSESGKLKWKTVFNKTAVFLGERRYDLADYFNSSPFLYNGAIYFGSGDGRICSVSATDGKLLWTFSSNDIIHASPVVYENKVFAGSYDGYLYALEAATGRLAWKFKSVGQEFFPKGEMQGSPVAFNGLVYVGSRDYNLYAIDTDGGYCHWNQKFPKGWALANCIQDSILYVATSEDRFIAAMNPSDGKELWRTDLKFNVFSPCVFSGTMLYVGNLMGKLFGIDRKTGAIRWTFTTDGFKRNHDKYFKPDDTFRDDIYTTIRNNVEYINAQLNWGALFSSPAITRNNLVISSTDGTVYCLGQ